VAGYSGKPLAEKLGVFSKLKKGGINFLIVNEPENYFRNLGELPADAKISSTKSGKFDLIHYFTKDLSQLSIEFEVLKFLLKKDGFLWISWPKGTSKIPTDLNENIIREIGLSEGMVDVKVAAVDDDWSALKFVFRLTDR
jgi:hypothetical protein